MNQEMYTRTAPGYRRRQYARKGILAAVGPTSPIGERAGAYFRPLGLNCLSIKLPRANL